MILLPYFTFRMTCYLDNHVAILLANKMVKNPAESFPCFLSIKTKVNSNKIGLEANISVLLRLCQLFKFCLSANNKIQQVIRHTELLASELSSLCAKLS